jgi:hypothetical protein
MALLSTMIFSMATAPYSRCGGPLALQRQRPFHIKISLVVCNGVRAAPPRQPLVLPPNFRDTTAEHVGTIIGIVGAPKPPKDKPK